MNPLYLFDLERIANLRLTQSDPDALTLLAMATALPNLIYGKKNPKKGLTHRRCLGR